MIGALFVICVALGYIAMELHQTNKELRKISNQIADVTTEDYLHLSRIRVEKYL